MPDQRESITEWVRETAECVAVVLLLNSSLMRPGQSANSGPTGQQHTNSVSGAAIMLKADTTLRELSDGRQSIDTALASLQDCCFEEGRNWRAQELFREHVLDDEFADMNWT